MTERSDPLRTMHREAEAAFTEFPPPDSVFASSESANHVVAGFGDPDAERAALRLGGALIDLSWKRVIHATGDDRLDFLNRMLTQELKGMRPGQASNAFWLNRKGRIEADIRLLHAEQETWLEVDAPILDNALSTLSSFVIIEDVELQSAASQWRTLALAGPRAHDWLTAATNEKWMDAAPGAWRIVHLAGAEVMVDFDDAYGSPGFRLLIPSDHVLAVHRHLNEVGASLNSDATRACRMVGWDAFDERRTEMAKPMFLIDYGTTSLPHETGVLQSRVSFTKGCFLGQEVVARMQSLGQPKQKCVALRIGTQDTIHRGDKLYPKGAAEADAIGVITSAANSIDEQTIALAQVKTKFAIEGQLLQLTNRVEAMVHLAPGL